MSPVFSVVAADLVSLGLVFGRTGRIGTAGIVARADGFPDLVGVGVPVLEECEGWTEIGVVGEVDAAYSEGRSCVDGVSDRGRGASTMPECIADADLAVAVEAESSTLLELTVLKSAARA